MILSAGGFLSAVTSAATVSDWLFLQSLTLPLRARQERPGDASSDVVRRGARSRPPGRIREAEAALATARRRAEAVVEIDAAGIVRPCPHCGGAERSRWGMTRAGAQRWCCGICARTLTGRTGTAVARLHRPGLFLEVARNMLDPHDAPLSCRKLARRLGLSRDTVWRWRMLILEHLKAMAPSTPLSGIVETDDTAQRESRKGSREWVRHERDPSQPKPPRRRWHEYLGGKPPQAISRKWSEKILGIVDREGRARFLHTGDIRQPTLDAALTPHLAPDAMVLFDGAPQYEAMARARGLSHHVLVAGRRRARTPKAFHLNSVNALHAQWSEISRTWRGPATKHLDGYARWLAARRSVDPVAVFRAMVVERGIGTNTISEYGLCDHRSDHDEDNFTPFQPVKLHALHPKYPSKKL